MNVTRTHRRLIRARRYANRQFLAGQAPTTLWTHGTSEWDSPSALRAAAKLAHRKYRYQLAEAMRNVVSAGTDCGGWDWSPPCGGCDRCQADQAGWYADRHRVHASIARWRLRPPADRPHEP